MFLSMKKALRDAHEECSSFHSTVPLSQSENISFSKTITNVNDNLLVDFLFVKNNSDKTIMHIVDSHTAYSEDKQLTPYKYIK